MHPETLQFTVIILPLVLIIILFVVWYLIYRVKEFEYKIDENSVTVNMYTVYFRSVWKIEKITLGGTQTLILHFDPSKEPESRIAFFRQQRRMLVPELSVALPDKDTEKIEKQIIEWVKQNRPDVIIN